MQCPNCDATDREINDADCASCEGDGICGFCQGEQQNDCPYDCSDSVCTVCDGSGFEEGYSECNRCGTRELTIEFETS